MKDKICLITGANSGIGKETALALAKQGATIVMLCRSEPKAKSAQQDIIRETKNTNIHIILCDLNDLKSVQQAAETFKENYPALHVLINNAGLMLLNKQLSVNNFESTLTINYLSHVLLTQLLLDKLISSSPSRIINITSSAHKMAKLNCNDLMLEKIPYKGFLAYSNSKLANILFTYTLAKQLEKTGVSVNAIDPGMVNTEFGDKVEFPLIAKCFTFFLRPWVKSPAKGALTSIKLGSDPELKNTTGAFWKNEQLSESSTQSHCKELQKSLWDKTQHLLKPYL